MKYKQQPDDYIGESREYSLPPEQVSLPDSEYYGQKEVKAVSKKLKRAGLISIASVLAIVEIFSSAAGFDFLRPDKDIPSGGEEIVVPTDDTEKDDDVFPKLDNLDPDFAGEYAWGDYGSEEYIRVAVPEDKDFTYIVAGGAWNSFGYSETTVKGASYDRNTNTLTLKNCTLDYLDVNLMGNGFTIKLEGENRIGGIKMWGAYYGGSLTLKGSGKLIVDGDLLFDGEFSQTCLMVDAELEVKGRIMISSTAMKTAIYYKAPLKLEGGEIAVTGDTVAENGLHYYDCAIVDGSGNPAQNVRFYLK